MFETYQAPRQSSGDTVSIEGVTGSIEDRRKQERKLTGMRLLEERETLALR